MKTFSFHSSIFCAFYLFYVACCLYYLFYNVENVKNLLFIQTLAYCEVMHSEFSPEETQ